MLRTIVDSAPGNVDSVGFGGHLDSHEVLDLRVLLLVHAACLAFHSGPATRISILNFDRPRAGTGSTRAIAEAANPSSTCTRYELPTSSSPTSASFLPIAVVPRIFIFKYNCLFTHFASLLCIAVPKPRCQPPNRAPYDPKNWARYDPPECRSFST
jgi:hypothetical protein